MNTSERMRLCDRCLREVPEGRGQFYEVRIDAVADPTPPQLDDATTVASLRKGYGELVEAFGETSPQEAMDQVHRRIILTLCNPCMDAWFNDPVGRESE